MGIPVGLSNFTGAFMQAYQGTKEKQAQDARQQAQDAMNKQQFDTLQQARQIDIANAIKTGQEHDVDRAAALKKQQLADVIDTAKRNVVGSFAQGDMHGALSGIEDYIAKDPNAPGKLVFARDANGKIAIGPDGKAIGNYVDASGKVIRSVNETPQDITAGFIARVNPDNYLKNQDEAAKDARDIQQKKDLENLRAKNDLNADKFRQGQENARQAALLKYKTDADRASADSEPVYALAVARLNPIYKTVRDSESARSMIASLRQSPQTFIDDYVKAKQSANTGLPVNTIILEAWRKEAADVASQIGILPVQGGPSPVAAPSPQLPPMPAPYIPTSANTPKPQAAKQSNLTDQRRKSILDDAWGAK